MSVNSRTVPVQIPGDPVAPDQKDLATAVTGLLMPLRLLSDGNDAKATEGALAAFGKTPASLAVLEAPATALAKWWTAGVAALGGSAAVVAAVKGFWSAQPTPVQIAVASGVAVIVAATIFAISLIVRADVQARSSSQAAEYAARAAVAVQFLQVTVPSQRTSGAEEALPGPNGSRACSDSKGTAATSATSSLGVRPQSEGNQNLLILTAAVAAGAHAEVRAPDAWQLVQGVSARDGRVEVQVPARSIPIDLVRDVRVASPSRD